MDYRKSEHYMPLPTHLNTNEAKIAAGTEVEFLRFGSLPSNPRSLEFAFSSEAPGRPFRLQFAHMELGEGRKRLRRSMFRTQMVFDSTNLIDNTIVTACRVTTVFEVPIGNLSGLGHVKDVGAVHGSVLMSRGVDSTILFNCTGVGMEALVNGSL